MQDHFIEQAIVEPELRTMVKFVRTLSGKNSIINGYTARDGLIHVNDARIIGSEYVTKSGSSVVFIVDRILMFPGFSCP